MALTVVGGTFLVANRSPGLECKCPWSPVFYLTSFSHTQKAGDTGPAPSEATCKPRKSCWDPSYVKPFGLRWLGTPRRRFQGARSFRGPGRRTPGSRGSGSPGAHPAGAQRPVPWPGAPSRVSVGLVVRIQGRTRRLGLSGPVPDPAPRPPSLALSPPAHQGWWPLSEHHPRHIAEVPREDPVWSRALPQRWS